MELYTLTIELAQNLEYSKQILPSKLINLGESQFSRNIFKSDSKRDRTW